MIWWLIASIVVTIGFLAWFVLRPNTQTNLSQKDANIELAKTKLAELKQDQDNALLSTKDLSQAELDIKQTLATELQQNEAVKIQTGLSKQFIISAILGFVLITGGIYQTIGTNNINQKLNLESVDSIEGLQLHVDKYPESVKVVKMLAYSYFSSNNLEKSKQYYQQAYQLAPNDIEILVEYASVLAAMQNNNLSGQPAKLIKQALEVDNNNLTALYLAGLAAYQNQQYELTKKAWQRALAQVKPGDKDHQAISTQLQNLEDIINKENPQVAPDISRSITVAVSLSKDLMTQASPEDFVLIYAKASTGRPAPLSIIKTKVKNLPITVVLTDEQSMIPGMNLANASKIVVVARLSKTGKAFIQAGDVEIKSDIINLSLINQPSLVLKLM